MSIWGRKEGDMTEHTRMNYISLLLRQSVIENRLNSWRGWLFLLSFSLSLQKV